MLKSTDQRQEDQPHIPSQLKHTRTMQWVALFGLYIISLIVIVYSFSVFYETGDPYILIPTGVVVLTLRHVYQSIFPHQIQTKGSKRAKRDEQSKSEQPGSKEREGQLLKK